MDLDTLAFFSFRCSLSDISSIKSPESGKPLSEVPGTCISAFMPEATFFFTPPLTSLWLLYLR
ncbi:hypothetical protein CDL12_25126 [Handroanthus impetiginosus]|uniref:Uncharacterized protein n=1 Tax=Handroanthus impetiginosus TaxID=429701 RepID=A0A2G9GAR7_9LAMI|nr:hypothetical protein CDL12_25126 [Handroanthus impetiginosus]